MMSHWVLQSGFEFEAGWTTLLDVLDRFAIPYSIHRVVPFVGDLLPEPDLRTNDVICIGSYAMRHYAKKRGWNPGVFDLEPHDFLEQLHHWGEAMLNADSQVMPFGDVKFDGERFIRPIDDSKSFAGRVFEWDEFSAWQQDVVRLGDDAEGNLTLKTLVQVCHALPIFQEVRCWVIDGRVVTASTYRQSGRVIYSDRVDGRFTDFATELAQRWSPDRAFCLDVCDTPDGLRAVEINTINSAGFYAADMQKLVMALNGLKQH